MSGHLIALMGPPGAGKSTWAQTREHVISTDAIRHGADYRTVYRIAMRELEARLGYGEEVVFDATCASPVTRRHLLDIAGHTQARTTLVVFTTPLADCVARQAGRDIGVSEERVRESWQAIADQVSDVHRESWQTVELVQP